MTGKMNSYGNIKIVVKALCSTCLAGLESTMTPKSGEDQDLEIICVKVITGYGICQALTSPAFTGAFED